MITREQAARVADLIRSLRPEWDSRLTTDVLASLDAQLPEVTAHALTVAGDRDNRTPAALKWNPLPTAAVAATAGPAGIGGLCNVCGRTRKSCETARRNAEAIGNAVHARHPERNWRDLDEHEFATGRP